MSADATVTYMYCGENVVDGVPNDVAQQGYEAVVEYLRAQDPRHPVTDVQVWS